MSREQSSCILPACLLGGSLAAAVIYLYSTSRPSASRKTTSRNVGVPGLYNLGNSCYANALLQGLSSVPSFVRWLGNLDLSHSELHDGFVEQLRDMVIQLNSGDCDTLSAAELVAALARHKWNITIGVEHDLHELLNVFVTTWEEELSAIRTHLCRSSLLDAQCSVSGSSFHDVGLPGNGGGDSHNREKYEGEGQEDLVSRASRVFRRCRLTVQLDTALRAPCFGLIATQLQCCAPHCAFKKVRHDRFSVISLSIPKSCNGVVTVESLLRKYFCMEVIRGASCDRCKDRDGKTDSGLLKKQGIAKLPPTLIIRIERVGVLPSGSTFKLSDHVEFGETLDLRHLCFYRDKQLDYELSQRSRQENCAPDLSSRILGGAEHNNGVSGLGRQGLQNGMSRGYALIDGGSFVAERREAAKYSYQLRAVSEHRGGPDSGHFVTYRRALTGSEHQWYLTNDTRVTRVPYSQVAASQAYMLYYERIQPNRWYGTTHKAVFPEEGLLEDVHIE